MEGLLASVGPRIGASRGPSGGRKREVHHSVVEGDGQACLAQSQA